MQHVFRLTLSHGNDRVEMDGVGARSGSIYHVSRDAIEGLWSSPSSKVSLSERETANGASPITDGEVLYAARTVTIPFHIQANYNHTNLTRSRTTLGRLIGKHDVVLDIYDDGDETQLTGYIETKYSDIPYEYVDTGTISFVCPDPRRISKNVKSINMKTASQASGGLSFGDGNAGLVFPLNFGDTDNQGNVGQMTNDGSYVAQPVITLHGGMTNPLIHWITSDGREGDLSYNGSVQNVPIVIDCDSRSATMGGLDVSYALGSRQWPSIPAGGSCNFSLLGSGSGWVTVQSHDVYI